MLQPRCGVYEYTTYNLPIADIAISTVDISFVRTVLSIRVVSTSLKNSLSVV